MRMRFASVLCWVGFILAHGCSPDDQSIHMNTSQDTGLPDVLNGPGLDMLQDMDVGFIDVLRPDAGMTFVVCDSDAQCAFSQVCLVDVSDGSRVCANPMGSKYTGGSCTLASDCRSGLCLNHVCTRPCAEDNNCPNNFLCREVAVPQTDGQHTVFGVCMEKPKPCLSNANCDDPHVCALDRMVAPHTLECVERAPGGMDLGASCAADSECLSNLCLDRMCTRPCERPNDCSTDGSYSCEPTHVVLYNSTNAQINLCKPRPQSTCLSDAQCRAPKRCVAMRGAHKVVFTCGNANANGADVGGSCANDTDCAQNFCLDFTCASPCQGTEECHTATGFSCELRNVVLKDNSLDAAQVCVPPLLCAQKNVCKINEQCYVTRSTSTIDMFCRTGNVGGGSLGQVCSSDSDCASNLCLEGRLGMFCSEPCRDHSDCAVAGYACQRTQVASSVNTFIPVTVCAPKTPQVCTSDEACHSGLTCAVISNLDKSALESVCIPDTGKKVTGVACVAHDDCASRVCDHGMCAAPCNDSTQCNASQLCSNATVRKSALVGDFNLCIKSVDTPCLSSLDCTDGLRVCGELRVRNGALTPFCHLPHTGGAQLGSKCSQNAQCREGLCLVTLDECSVVCADDTDCSTTQNQICSTFTFAADNHIDMCVRACTGNGSCASGDMCTINSDRTHNDIDQVCSAPIGVGKLGDSCTTSSDCRTGLCLGSRITDETSSCTMDSHCDAHEVCRCPIEIPGCTKGKQCIQNIQRCSRVCSDASDCLHGAAGNTLTSCSTHVVVTRPDGVSTKLMSFCKEPT